MSMVLHQFAISHFCEKVRWALELKGVDHELKGHVPGLHARTARRLTGRTSVPVLELDAGEAIGGSADILDRLDVLYPEPRLTPAKPEWAAAARQWEQQLDERLGSAIRRVCYATLLDHRDVCLPLLTAGTPWYGKTVMRVMWSRIVPVMRKRFGLNPQAIAEAHETIESILDELEQARDEQGYLVGGRFTRADLTAAALFAPLTREPGYGLQWPDTLPDPLGEFAQRLAPRLVWVSDLYGAHRKRAG